MKKGSNLFRRPGRAAWFASAALFVFCVSAQAQAPIYDASQPTSRGKQQAPSPISNPNVELYQQLQALQQEVMTLRGTVEEQGHQIEILRKQGLDRYNDLDRRLSGGQSQGAAAPAAAAAASQEDAAPANGDGNANGAEAGAINASTTPAPPTNEAQPEEYEAYKQAYAKVKSQDFSGAIKAFNAFLASYPNSTLAPNAYYWLGELHLQTPTDLNASQQAFTKVVGDYPQNNKAPDALYKLAKVYFLKGDKAKSKQLMQQVIDDYGSSGSSAPQLAKQFLDQNFHK